jgi:hypothetical protein
MSKLWTMLRTDFLKPEREGGLRGSTILFISFVLLFVSIGIPIYLFDRERQAQMASERRKQEEALERQRALEARRAEIEASARATSSPSGAIHGPTYGGNPSAVDPGSAGRSPYDYLPPEQLRMIQAGRQNPLSAPGAGVPRPRQGP